MIEYLILGFLDQGVIKPSNIGFASWAVFVKKKVVDGKH